MARKPAKVTGATELRDRINTKLKANVVTLGSDAAFDIEKIPTGSLVVDRLTGGGFARGRHTLLYGDFMVGKSLVLYKTLALAQQRGETVLLIDAEGVFNASWFEALGGNPGELVIYPDRESTNSNRNANELGNALRVAIDKGEGVIPVDVIGIDSVASLLPQEEEVHDLEAGDPRVASLARLMPLLLRMLTTKNDKTAIIWVNQWRDKISHIPGLKSTPGGRSLGFYSSTTIEMMTGEKETEEREVVVKGKLVKRKVALGRWVNCTVKKEKTGARPETSMAFLLDWDTKMPNHIREVVDLGMVDGLITRAGDYFTVGDRRVHGVKRLVNLLTAEEELLNELAVNIEAQSFALGMVGDDE